MEGFIEGLKVKITAKEMKAHLENRAAHHTRRADEKEKELPALRDALERIKGAQTLTADDAVHIPAKTLSWLNEFTGGPLVGYQLNAKDVLNKLVADISNQRKAAGRYAFIVAHLTAADQTFLLTEADLIRLEFVEGDRSAVFG